MRLHWTQAGLLLLTASFLGACSDDASGTEPCLSGTIRAGDACVPSGDAGPDADGGLPDTGTDAPDATPDQGDTGGGITLPFAVDDVGYVPSGFFGDGETPGGVSMDNTCPMRAGGEQGNCHRATWTPGIGSDGFAGVFWQYPANNWGDLPGLDLPSGATEVSFSAWGVGGGEVVTFLAGIGDVDGFGRDSGPITLTNTPTEYTIDLCFAEYTDVVGGFGWSAGDATEPVVFHVDDIVWRVGETECEEEQILVPFSIDEAGYVPSGFFGDGETAGAVAMSNACSERAGDEAGNCHHVEWTPGVGDAGFAGVWWQFPANNWGEEPGLALPTGATDVSFYAWGDSGGEVVNFLAGLSVEVDGFQRGSGEITLSTTPTQHTISLCGIDYNEVVGAFAWLAADATETVAFNIDDVQWTASGERCQGDTPLVILEDVGYVASGYFGDFAGITDAEVCGDPRPGEGYGRCHQFTWDPVGSEGFAGIFWLYPPDSNVFFDPDADTLDPGLMLPEGATEVAFDAWAANGNETVEFFTGFTAEVDGFRRNLITTLTTEPTEYTIDLCGVAYDEVVSAFGWVTNDGDTPVVFNVDNLVWREAAEACPGPSDDLIVFDDEFATGVSFVGFEGAINDLSIDSTQARTGAASLKFLVPATSYGGGAFALDTPADLSSFDALVFWAKADAAHTLNVVGIGINSRTPPTHEAEWANLALTTEWTRYVVPIPDPARLTAEDGLFHLAEGSDEGAYTIWLDDVQYTTLGDAVLGVRAPVIATSTANLTVGGMTSVTGTAVTFPVNSVNQTLTASPRYFAFATSNDAFATVAADGTVTAVAVGTANITATLAGVPAAGALTVNVTETALAQVDLPITFDDPTVDYTVTDFGGAATTLVADPTNGSNTVASTNKPPGAELWAGTTMSTDALGLATAIPFTADDTIMTVRVYSPDAGIPVRLKVETVGDPTRSVETEATTTVANAWETLTFDFANEAGGTAALNLAFVFNKASIFFNFGTTGTDAGDKTYLWDDIEFIGGGGGGDTPTTAAPAPTTPAEDVTSIFSDAYDDLAGVDFNPNWGQATVFSLESIDGNDTLKYAGLNYQGIDFGGGQDVSGRNMLHLDFWTPDLTAVSFFLISSGPVETAVNLPIETGTWVSVDIPLSQFSGVNLSDLIQFKLDAQAGVAGTIFIDNLYFYSVELPTEPTTAAPTPTTPAEDVTSIFSDAYDDLAGVDFNPNWGQATVFSLESIDGNDTLKYAGLNYQGIDLNGAQDVSGRDTLHLDFWTPDLTVVSFFLISSGPVEAAVALPIETGTWVSVDIPLTQFGGVDLTNVIQFKLDAQAGVAGTIFIDNLYFYSGGGGGDCVATGDELTINGDFETGDISCWTDFSAVNNGTFAATMAQANGGQWSGNLVASVPGGGGPASFPVVKQANLGIGTVTPNTSMTISFDLYGSMSGVGGVVFAEFFSELTGGGTSSSVILGGGSLVPTSTWTHHTFTTTTGTDVSGGVTLQLKTDCGANPGCVVDAYFDNVSVTVTE